MDKTVEGKASIKNGVMHTAFIGLAVIGQIFWSFAFFYWVNEQYTWISVATRVFSVVLVLIIYGNSKYSTLKMVWIMVILAAPILGVVLYVLLGMNVEPRRMGKRVAAVNLALEQYIPGDEEALQKLTQKDAGIANQFRYLSTHCKFPVYCHTSVTYFADTTEALASQLRDMEQAREFIYLEYFAVEDGEAFRPVKDLLFQKAAQGVEVRLFYDELGSAGYIDKTFIRHMAEHGVKCRVFNPVVPFVNMFMNNRNHRKITVIDGRVAYTGGYNMADEYFHVKEPCGFWKDTGVRLEGPAVWTLLGLTMAMWNAGSKEKKEELEDFGRYLPVAKIPANPDYAGYVQPYADSPLDDERVGENVYMNLINNAKRYVYFVTPYLIITDEMRKAFCLAARRGVDVRIITPGIPDKKLVYQITRSYYPGLATEGVRIYEYTPGFCHAKQVVCDDEIAIVGTINLDYRSLYHHFEDGVLFYDTPAVGEVRKDFDRIFPQCSEVTGKYSTGAGRFLRLGLCALRLIAPLL